MPIEQKKNFLREQQKEYLLISKELLALFHFISFKKPHIIDHMVEEALREGFCSKKSLALFDIMMKENNQELIESVFFFFLYHSDLCLQRKGIPHETPAAIETTVNENKGPLFH